MKISDIEELVSQYNIQTGPKRKELDRAIRQAEREPKCYYCNFSLRCGQLQCIWGDDVA